MGRSALVTMLVLLCFGPAANGQMVQPPARPQPGAAPGNTPAEKGTAVVRGRITAGDTGRALRRAQISLSAPEGERRTTSTNLRGEYEFSDLLPGRYTVVVSRSGYLSWEYGRRRPGEPGRPLDVADGQNVAGIDFALSRAGVISGRVIDENGEAVAGVSVWPMRREFFRGRRRLVPVGGSSRTDDIGQYRILGLAPGEYILMAQLRETWTVPGPPKQVLGYATTYHPGAANASEALPVKLAAGKEAPSTDISLVAARTATISGIATSSDGRPLSGSSVGLSQNVIGPGGASYMGFTSATVADDGSWRMRNLPPGDYELSVSSQQRAQVRETGRATITVQGADLEGIALVTDAGSTISGQIVTDDGQPLPSTPSRLRVVVEPLGPDSQPVQIVMGDDNGLVGSDGKFSFRGASGLSLIKVTGVPRPWAVKSIDAGDRDHADGAISLTGGQKLDDVKITLTARFPTVTARVTDDRGAPAEGTVILFPADESKWLGLMDNIRVGRAGPSSTVQLDRIRPGDYLAAALDTVQLGQIADPEFLAQLRDSATRVTVREGENAPLVLKVKK